MLLSGREPLHKGKPISYWVDHACLDYDGDGLDGKSVWDIRNEVKRIGPAAVPYLVKRLRTRDGWRDLERSLWARLPGWLQQHIPEVRTGEEIRYGAAQTLGLFGADAKAAVPDLVRLLTGDKHPIIEALTAIGPDARAALPGLHGMLTNQNMSVRVELAGALWCIGKETNTVLQICTNALGPGVADGDTMNAGYLLSLLGTAGAAAAPLELNVLLDTNHSTGTRGNCVIALASARANSPELHAALLDGIKEGQDQLFRCNCAMGLWSFDSQYAPLATRLVIEDMAAEKKRFPGNEQNLVLWLEQRKLDLQECIPTLKQLCDSDSADIRKEAAIQLKNIEAKIKAGKSRANAKPAAK